MGKDSWTDITRVWPCEVRYRIDMEYRRWGIAGATLALDGSPITVEVEVKTETGPEDNPQVSEGTKTISIDPSKIQVELAPGPSIGIHSMELRLNPDFTVDYGSSSIHGSSLMGVPE
jgi:hypothetical protein